MTIGGVVRAVNTVDLRTDQAGRYVTVDMPVEDVRLLECGCWLIGTTPPGQSRQHPPRVVIQRCAWSMVTAWALVCSTVNRRRFAADLLEPRRRLRQEPGTG